MKRLTLVRLRTCAQCRRAIVILKSDDGEHTLAIPIEAEKARELLSRYQERSEERFLADFLLQLLASSPSFLSQVVLDCNTGGFLSARVDVSVNGKTKSFSCASEEGLGLAIAAEVPLYAVERILEQKQLFHPLETESENPDALPRKPKPVLH